MMLRRGSRGFLLPLAREKTIPASPHLRAGRYCMGKGACVLYIFTIPLKPMKAMARMPAEMRAMGMPRILSGSSVRLSCSRMPAKTTSAKVKPKAMEMA